MVTRFGISLLGILRVREAHASVCFGATWLNVQCFASGQRYKTCRKPSLRHSGFALLPLHVMHASLYLDSCHVLASNPQRIRNGHHSLTTKKLSAIHLQWDLIRLSACRPCNCAHESKHNIAWCAKTSVCTSNFAFQLVLQKTRAKSGATSTIC